jgi:hypothetical protein
VRSILLVGVLFFSDITYCQGQVIEFYVPKSYCKKVVKNIAVRGQLIDFRTRKVIPNTDNNDAGSGGQGPENPGPETVPVNR